MATTTTSRLLETTMVLRALAATGVAPKLAMVHAGRAVQHPDWPQRLAAASKRIRGLDDPHVLHRARSVGIRYLRGEALRQCLARIEVVRELQAEERTDG